MTENIGMIEICLSVSRATIVRVDITVSLGHEQDTAECEF